MPAPGGTNSPVYVYKASTGTWVRQTTPWYVNSSGPGGGGTWVRVKRLFRAVSTSINPSTLLPETTWAEVVDYRSLSGVSVPGVSIAKRPASQIAYGARVSWTTVSDTSDIRNSALVNVDFYNETTGAIYTTSQNQSVGAADSPQWDMFDHVHAVVYYQNDNGSGAQTTTATVTLGP